LEDCVDGRELLIFAAKVKPDSPPFSTICAVSLTNLSRKSRSTGKIAFNRLGGEMKSV